MYFKFLLTLSLFCGSFVYSAHHEASEKAGYSEQEIINIAMSAAPSNVSSEATIIDSTGKVLREGSNDWTCMPGTPPNENVNPMCVDQAWQKWCKPLWHKPPMTRKTNPLERLIC